MEQDTYGKERCNNVDSYGRKYMDYGIVQLFLGHVDRLEKEKKRKQLLAKSD